MDITGKFNFEPGSRLGRTDWRCEGWGKQCRPYPEYRSKKGNLVVQYGNPNFGPDRDRYARDPLLTFRTPQDFRVTHGIGELREIDLTLKWTLKTLEDSVKALFVQMGPELSEDGLPLRYIGFVQCDGEAVLRECLTTGDSGEMLFSKPNVEKKLIPEGLHYIIRAPIPMYKYPREFGTSDSTTERQQAKNHYMPCSTSAYG